MEFFRKAKAIRLKSRHDKYLLAEEDEESVSQDRNGSSKTARWTVEFVVHGGEPDSYIRLKSCFNKYLTASNAPFLLGMTGRKVLQTLPRKLDSSLEWEPIRDGSQVKLKTRYGNFLRANGGVPPWRNSVTHDVPHRTATQDWVFWDVDVLEIQVQITQELKPPTLHQPPPQHSTTTTPDPPSRSSSFESSKSSFKQSNDSSVNSLHKPVDGRIIYYSVVEDDDNFDDSVEEDSFNFKGNGVDELTHKLEEEIGIQDIIVCTRSPLNGKLHPLQLRLPPNNATMHVIVVPSSSKVARDFAKLGIL